MQQFRTSRITVGRALKELAQRGLVERVAGSGTYVRQSHAPGSGLVFGLLIPDLGLTEVFEPMCRGIAASPQAGRHALLWGHTTPGQPSPEEQALELCDQYIERAVSGVFFAPIEKGANVQKTNMTVVARLEKARIPIVLLDRCVMPYPNRCAHDLVGIDNRRAGYMVTEHLIRLGVRRLSMVAYAGGAPTVEARIAGFREALLAHGIASQDNSVCRLETITQSTVAPLMEGKRGVAGFVCANDRTAGQLMQVMLDLGYRIPRNVRIAGIDDVEYASLLPVPLTTVRQPCREIGEAAMAAMLDRVERPSSAVRDILVECHLVVRESCGATNHKPRLPYR